MRTSSSAVLSIVAIGASAGGLDACAQLLDGLPPASGAAFIVVQHLDPSHENMLVTLLSSHTAMPVCEAREGMPVEADKVYVIRPGNFLSIRNGHLSVTPPVPPQLTRLPFDLFLTSLAADLGDKALCVVLSGTGADGMAGVREIKRNGGYVVAQNPDEAAFGGMPESAISSGAVDAVLPVSQIPAALIEQLRKIGHRPPRALQDDHEVPPEFVQILDLLRTNTTHDFGLYKTGTLRRRIERRMSLANPIVPNMGAYLAILRRDAGELELLAKDLLINVTSFFRDVSVFDYLAANVIPEIIQAHQAGEGLRAWIPGCSSGEESYSLAMILLEGIAHSQRNIKLQIFASDADGDAVSSAREGFFPLTIASVISPERLARFFIKEEAGYRVSAELRASVVFTVQDVLLDPPFSRLDLISCRNLLIYFGSEAQRKALWLFHFGLRPGGYLVLGSAETAGDIEGRFKVVSKPHRIYKQIARGRGGEMRFPPGSTVNVRVPARAGKAPVLARPQMLADLSRRLVLENHAPAAVLINRKHELLFSLGKTERYLQVSSGTPSHNILSMVAEPVRTKLRAAIQRVSAEFPQVVVKGCRIGGSDAPTVSIDVRRVAPGDEEFILIAFLDEVEMVRPPLSAPARAQNEGSRVAVLESELQETRQELAAAIHNLETSSEEHKALNEEALSVNEEYQSANEELLTSKEELQSLNEELTAVNSQLQETLERQRRISNDLQNVLYSTEVATLFLDDQLNIRFYTPATASIFSVIPGDIGRPLADLRSRVTDETLLDEVRDVQSNMTSSAREIQSKDGLWFARRIMPYRTRENATEGVVITYTDTTQSKIAAESLATAKRLSDIANTAKSRFLAAASHDLRQPLQALTLLQEMLGKSATDERSVDLLHRLGDVTRSMSGMLNALLDLNQIESGVVQAYVMAFSIRDLLERLHGEFDYVAKEQNIEIRVVACSATVYSDPHLLEQILRNFMANALKYTEAGGKILLGCRNHKDTLTIGVWDTGVGIPADHIESIFEEYYQVDNAARERSRGLGLGLSIVKRLAALLGHKLNVLSRVDAGSCFSVEVRRHAPRAQAPFQERRKAGDVRNANRTGHILVVEDDPEVRELLGLLLVEEGHSVTLATDGPETIKLLGREVLQPDLMIIDYNLPGGMDGLTLSSELRKTLRRQVPTIILTGDMSMTSLRDIAAQDCQHLNKPVEIKRFNRAIQMALGAVLDAPVIPQTRDSKAPTLFVVDDNAQVRQTLKAMLEDNGETVEAYPTGEAFLRAYRPGTPGCLLLDAFLPGMSGVDLLQRLRGMGDPLPTIMITGRSDIAVAVQAMKEGASDFLEKPINRSELFASIGAALDRSRDVNTLYTWRLKATQQIASLTQRQRQIMEMVLAGNPNKNIAIDLGISQRTVETHRALIMKKTGAKSIPELARLAIAAGWGSSDAQGSSAAGK